MSTATSNQQTNDQGWSSDARHLDSIALAGAGAVVSAAVMLLLGVFGAIGVYEGAVEMMAQWHLFFEPTVVGTVAGMIEAAVVSFVLVYPFGRLYNVLAR